MRRLYLLFRRRLENCVKNNHKDRKKGIQCWLSERDGPSSESRDKAIIDAIINCQFFVLILSSKSNKSKQVLREVDCAVNNDRKIIPFRIEDFDPFGALAYYILSEHWIDAITSPLEEHIERLTTAIISLHKNNLERKEIKTNSQDIDERSRDNFSNKQKLMDKVVDLFTNNKKNTIDKYSFSSSSMNLHNQEIQVDYRVLDTIKTCGKSSNGEIQLCVGDLCDIRQPLDIDVLVVWTTRNEYKSIPGSVIGKLNEKGISIEQLSKNKEIDLRQAFSCWLSKEITEPPQGIRFNRILCYEPEVSSKSAELVGDIFRSLAPFLGGQFPIRSVATGLLASGQLMKAKKVMLEQLVEAAVHWMSSGLPIDCLKVFCSPDKRIDELTSLFSSLKNKYETSSLEQSKNFTYDLFISYSHEDIREVDLFTDILFSYYPELRIFIDKNNLNTGVAWQREIFEAIDDCSRVAAFYSPTYLESKVCIEEFNIALCRHRESDDNVLMPIYLYSADLPTYMKMIQFFDCREFNKNKFHRAAKEFLAKI